MIYFYVLTALWLLIVEQMSSILWNYGIVNSGAVSFSFELNFWIEFSFWIENCG